MKLLDFVARESIVVDLRATAKEQAIREMVGSLHDCGRLANDDVESIIRAILGAKSSARPASEWAWPFRTRGIRRSSAWWEPSPSHDGASISPHWTVSRSIFSFCLSRPRTSLATIFGHSKISPGI